MLGLLAAVPAFAQDLLPLERRALAARAAGDPAAVTLLVELATASAATAGDDVAAARVEAWANCALQWLATHPDGPAFAALDGLLESPLAQSQPLLRDRLGTALLEFAAANGRADAARRADELGCLGSFSLIGPFDNERGGGYRRALAPEQRVDLDAELEGKRRAVRWRALPPLPGGKILQLDRIVHPHEQSLVYVATAVLADAATTAVLELGSTGAWRAFCNGAEVGSREVERALRRDQDAVVLPLVAGSNLLLLKLCHQEGAAFAFTARLRAPDGRPLAGVRTSGAAADLRAAAATAPAPAAGAPPPCALGGRSTWAIETVRGADAVRLAWLWRARAADGDQAPRALAAAERAVAELPDLPESHLLLASARTSHGRSAADRDENERRRALEQALALDEKHVTALVNLGRLLRDGSNLWQQARALADRALAVQPAFAPALLLRHATMADEQLDAASRPRLAAAAADPAAGPELWRTVASWHADSPAQALALRRRVLALQDLEGDAVALARLLLRTGDLEAGRQLLESVVARDPFAIEARMALAELHLATSDPRTAVRLAEEWLQVAPDDAETMLFAARCWRRLVGEADDAAAQQLALLRSALEVEPNRRDEERYAEYLAKAVQGEADPFFTAYRRDGAALLKADPGPPTDAKAANDALHWLLRQRVVRANGNGTTNEYVHYAVRILTEDGARQFASFRLPYWGGEQRARLLACAIHRADGTVQRPALRGASVAMPNLRPGDVVDLEGRIDDLAPKFFGDRFGLVHLFGAPEGSPVATSELIVIADPGREYRHQQENGAPAPGSETLADGRLLSRWLMQDLPRDVPELRRPDRKEHDPIVRMSTYRDWDHFASWWWNLIKKQIEVTPAMRAKVQELCAGLASQEQRIAAIYRFVTTDVRYEAWEFGVHGYKPYSTAVIYERRHGDCKDKALLLCALLGEIGVQCRPVLIFADPMRSEDDLTLAMVEQFNHCIAWLPEQDGRPAQFLDGTATWHPTDTLPEMDQGAKVLIVDQGRAELREVPWTTPQHNRGTAQFDVTLRPDGSAALRVQYRPTGNSATELRAMLATEPALRREQLERRLVRQLGKLELSDLQASDPLALGTPVDVTATAALPELGQRSARRWQLPSTWQDGDLQAFANESGRRTPLLLGVPAGNQQSVRYRIPAGWRLVDLPAPVAATTSFGTFAMRWAQLGDQVVVERTLDFTVPRIQPADYQAFRDFVATVKAADAQFVLLQKEDAR